MSIIYFKDEMEKRYQQLLEDDGVEHLLIHRVDFKNIFHRDYSVMDDKELFNYLDELKQYQGSLKHKLNCPHESSKNESIDIQRYKMYNHFPGYTNGFIEWLNKISILSSKNIEKNKLFEIKILESEIKSITDELKIRGLSEKNFKLKTSSRVEKNKNLASFGDFQISH